ncbi:hypothetical protein OH76DRAFT_1408471 [Lentinus brumalis]|uniref:Uncharacterized protein n=2 Tax=Polyporaceae TaxID=5317 RepID=A0A371CXM3_9APHY|nr:hypothetical protein OH76DRAFT_1408471 [Polyporus brumalis]
MEEIIGGSTSSFSLDPTPSGSDRDSSSSNPIVLDPHPTSPKVNWFKWWPIPAFSAAYGVHRYYRRYRPRTLPVLTPLRLPELYISIALAFVVAGDSVEREEAVIDDRHLLTIELAGRRAFDALLDPELGDRFGNIDKKLLSDEHKEELRRIREARYYDGTLSGKIAWWHNHLWSDDRTWNEWSSLIGLRIPFSEWPKKAQDWDTLVTHIANSCDDYDYGSGMLTLLALAVPFGMLARWTRRPLLFRPVNGLQRLLWGSYLYFDFGRENQHWRYLQQIQDKEQCAKALTHVFGDFEEDIQYAQEEGLPRIF